MKPDSYVCENCHETFDKGWSDEAAATELDATFGLPVDQCAIVCNDCYTAMLAWLAATPGWKPPLPI